MAKKLSFAKSFEELEKIAAWFESEEVDVEEGLKKFEEGLALAQACKERLAAIENRVVEIKKKFELEGAAPEETTAPEQESAIRGVLAVESTLILP